MVVAPDPARRILTKDIYPSRGPYDIMPPLVHLTRRIVIDLTGDNAGRKVDDETPVRQLLFFGNDLPDQA